jgi:arylsulfatase A-like enzyme
MHSNRRRLQGFFALILLLSTAGLALGAGEPNILLLVADDVGAEASSLYPKLAGSSGAVSMPNLEKLAAGGLVFENAWVNPMCSPTRSTILTGLYGHHTGVLIAGDVLATSTTTIWDYIRKESPAKYDMAVFGKYHLGGNGGNVQHVIDMRVPNFRGFLGAQINDYYNWVAYDSTGASSTVQTYATTALTDWAIEFIKKHEATRPQDPWFVYVPYNAAHTPNQVPPANLHSTDVGGLQPGARGGSSIPVYKAMMQALDTEMGRLLKSINLTNTLVIYVGDNGTPAFVKDTGTGVRGSKTSTWEGGARVPMVMAGAGVTRQGREAALVNGVDLYATIAAAAGIKVTKANDGYSVLPLLSNAGASTGRNYAFTEFCSAGVSRFAIRDREYKLIYDNAVGWGLYNLLEDQTESKNLYNNPGYSAPQAKLQSELDKLKASATKGCFR